LDNDVLLGHKRKFAVNTQKIERISLWKYCKSDINPTWQELLDKLTEEKPYYERLQKETETALISAGVLSDELCKYKTAVKDYPPASGKMASFIKFNYLI
jgi:hypothetical protein